MESINQRITATVRQLLEWLVTGDFGAIERYTNGVRLSAGLISDAVSEYGHKLVMPPPEVFENLDVIEVIEIIGASPKRWSVRFDLWTEDERRSDLSFECTLIDSEVGLLKTEIDNIHVL